MAGNGRVQRLLQHILRQGSAAAAAQQQADGAVSPGSSATPTSAHPQSPGHAASHTRRVSLNAQQVADKDGSVGGAAAQRIRIGICAMDKKAKSKPMREIIGRLVSFGEFEIVNFGDEVRGIMCVGG